MTRSNGIASLLVLAALVAGCPKAPTATRQPVRLDAASPAPAASSNPGAASVASPGPQAAGTLDAPLPTPSTVTMSRDPGVGLAGLVQAPPGLISDHGAGLISSGGGGLISSGGGGVVANNGAGFRLAAAPAQVVAAGLPVLLLDAAGKPVLGPDGKPLETVTDASGRYRFAGVVPSRNMIVAVRLPGDKGELRAIAPNAATAADVDLVSTLTTTYILDRYVASQQDQDPGRILDKLPREVESATRDKAASALASGGVAVPDQLTPQRVVATVEALRAANGDLDAQLEVVKRLLVAAGQSDLGNGLPGTEVSLGSVDALAAGKDGSLYIADVQDARVWRLAPDGRITTAIGKGPGTPDAVVSGKPATEVRLYRPSGLVMDANDRLVLFEKEDRISQKARITRLDGKGVLEELLPLQLVWPDTTPTFPAGYTTDKFVGKVPLGLARGPQGEVLLLAEDGSSYVVEAGKPLVPWALFGALYQLSDHALDDRKRVLELELYNGAQGLRAQVTRSAVGGALETVLSPDDPDVVEAQLAAGGEIITLGPTRELGLIRSDGTRQVLATKVPPDMRIGFGHGLVAPNGDVYTSSDTVVYRVRGGQVTRVAGNDGGGSGNATELSLANPRGLAAIADGFVVADRDGNRLLKVGLDGKATTIAGTGEAWGAISPGDMDGGPYDATQPATRTRLRLPSLCRAAADGTLYFVDDLGKRLGRVETNGTFTTLKRYESIRDLAVLADGRLMLLAARKSVLDGIDLFVLDPASGADTQVKHWTGHEVEVNNGAFPFFGLAATPAGVTVVAPLAYFNWTPAGGLGLLKLFPKPLEAIPLLGGVVADERGRLVIAQGKKLVRFDPVANTFTAVAGAGSSHFTGSGTDDGLSDVTAPAFGKNGELLFCDPDHKQIKRIAAAELP